MKKNLLNLFAFCTTFSYLIAEENIQNHTDDTIQTEQSSPNSTNDCSEAEIKESGYNWKNIATGAIVAIIACRMYDAYRLSTKSRIDHFCRMGATGVDKKLILKFLEETLQPYVRVVLNYNKSLNKEDAIKAITAIEDHPTNKTMTLFDYIQISNNTEVTFIVNTRVEETN